MQTEILDADTRKRAADLFGKIINVQDIVSRDTTDQPLSTVVCKALVDVGLAWHPADGYVTFADCVTGWTYSFPWSGDWDKLWDVMFPRKGSDRWLKTKTAN